MNSIIEQILILEREYGHNELFNGVSDEEGALDKLSLICSTIDHITYTEDSGGTTEALRSLANLINVRALSPESLAYLLFLMHPDDDIKFKAIDRLYQNRSNEDHATFQAVYFAQKYEEADNNYHLFDRFKLINEKYRLRYGKETPEKFSGKGAVYTVITGEYENLKDPQFVDPEWDYYCFTDEIDKYSSDIWNIRKLDHIMANDLTKTQRYAKTHPFLLLPEYDYTIYLDGSFTIVGDLREYINIFSKGCSMLCFPHPARQKLKDEVEAIKVLRYHQDPSIRNNLDDQIDAYRSEGYNDDLPLIESGCLVRTNHDPLLNMVMEDWWKEIKNRSHRDQLSIGYVCWKNNYLYDISALEVTNNKYLSYCDHIDRY